MADKHTQASEASKADMESVEALLDDLDFGDEDVALEAVEETIEQDAAETVSDDEVTADDLRDLELKEDREEAYKAQKSSTGADTKAVKEAKADTKKRDAGKKRAASKTEKTSSPRTPRDISTIPAEFFVLEGTVADGDLEAAKAATIALMPKQKKIAEKFENLFGALSVGKQPSVYVVQAFKLLDDKGVLSSKELVASFKTSYAQGTAMSQAGQIMNLFDTVKIATRANQTLTLNKDSVVAQRIRDILAASK